MRLPGSSLNVLMEPLDLRCIHALQLYYDGALSPISKRRVVRAAVICQVREDDEARKSSETEEILDSIIKDILLARNSAIGFHKPFGKIAVQVPLSLPDRNKVDEMGKKIGFDDMKRRRGEAVRYALRAHAYLRGVYPDKATLNHTEVNKA